MVLKKKIKTSNDNCCWWWFSPEYNEYDGCKFTILKDHIQSIAVTEGGFRIKCNKDRGKKK